MATEKMLTPMFRVSYPKLFKKDPNDDKEKCTVSMVFDKAQIAADPKYKAQFMALVAMLKAAAAAHYPAGNATKPMPMKDGTQEKPGDEVYGNAYFIEASTQFQPDVFGRDKVTDIRHQNVPDGIYAGCYARAQVHAYPWKNDKNGCGIGLGFDAIQKLEEGEPLSTGQDRGGFDDLEPLAGGGGLLGDTSGGDLLGTSSSVEGDLAL